MDSTTFIVGALVAMQALQTLQIAIVGRKVSQSLRPPPRAHDPFCVGCGALCAASELREGLCVSCRTARQRELWASTKQ